MRGFWAALALLVLTGATEANAQSYPSRPITLVVPFPPGGSTDAAARIMAERMRSPLGQSIVIPTDIAAKIPDACELCARRETPILEIARSPDFTLEKLKAALKRSAEIH